MGDLLEIRDLRLQFNSMRGTVKALDGVNLTVREREIIGLVGESGCGKTITGLAVLGLLPRPQTEVTAGQILFRGEDLLAMGDRAVEGVRGRLVAMVFQDPLASLNPVFTIGDQISRVVRLHKKVSRREALEATRRALKSAGLPPDDAVLDSYPHQLSGGMRQRACMAMALSCDAPLLIADEPTTALDVTIQAQMLRLLLDLREELGVAQVLITHNVGVAAQTCDRVAVMYAGSVVEQGLTAEVLKHARHPYTMALYECLPQGKKARELHTIPGSVPDLIDPPTGCRFHPRCAHAMDVCVDGQAGADPADEGALGRLPLGGTAARGRRGGRPVTPLLTVDDLCVHFAIKRGLSKKSADVVHAADDISFAIAAGETFALVGESGSGKTTVARAILGLNAPSSGSIAFQGRDLTALKGGARREALRDVQVVFQDPYSSLSPRMTVHDVIAEPLRANSRISGRELNERILALLEMVGLGTQHLWRRPHEFSGGQCQRIAIARALALEPKLVILDEPTSALDVSVQARILVLLEELQERLQLAYLFIAHDLAVVESVADRVAVMYLGQIVETGEAAAVLHTPRHPYTYALIASVPSPDPERRSELGVIAGEMPSAIHPPSGCRFHPRCPFRMEVCEREEPKPHDAGGGRMVSCHLPDGTDLSLPPHNVAKPEETHERP